MECDEARPLLDAYLDGELGEAERADLRDHVEGCAECGPEAAALERLRDGIRQIRPGLSRARGAALELRAALRREAAESRPAAMARVAGWLAYAASILIAVAVGSGGTWLIAGQRQQDTVADEVIDSHLRSLLAGHLTDVASSDKHTVKPWFAGPHRAVAAGRRPRRRKAFRWSAAGSTWSRGKPVPALVYRAGKHMINVFVLPAGPGDHGETVTRRGYTLRHWSEGDLGYWAVSDAAPDEFAKFEQTFRAATGS